jgi:hypothetical protein
MAVLRSPRRRRTGRVTENSRLNMQAAHISRQTPSSITWSAGRLKNEVASVALRDIKINMLLWTRMSSSTAKGSRIEPRMLLKISKKGFCIGLSHTLSPALFVLTPDNTLHKYQCIVSAKGSPSTVRSSEARQVPRNR